MDYIIGYYKRIGFIANGFEGDMEFPPTNVAIEKVLNENFAIGLFAGYAKYHDVLFPAGSYSAKDIGLNYGYTLIGGSISKHFQGISSDIDLYGRIYLEYALVSASTFGFTSISNVSQQSDFAIYGGYMGIILYIAPFWGINGEVGYGNTSIIRIGILIRI